jgi:hypothetical protein
MFVTSNVVDCVELMVSQWFSDECLNDRRNARISNTTLITSTVIQTPEIELLTFL